MARLLALPTLFLASHTDPSTPAVGLPCTYAQNLTFPSFALPTQAQATRDCHTGPLHGTATLGPPQGTTVGPPPQNCHQNAGASPGPLHPAPGVRLPHQGMFNTAAVRALETSAQNPPWAPAQEAVPESSPQPLEGTISCAFQRCPEFAAALSGIPSKWKPPNASCRMSMVEERLLPHPHCNHHVTLQDGARPESRPTLIHAHWAQKKLDCSGLLELGVAGALEVGAGVS